jgi:hypothetical protein
LEDNRPSSLWEIYLDVSTVNHNAGFQTSFVQG